MIYQSKYYYDFRISGVKKYLKIIVCIIVYYYFKFWVYFFFCVTHWLHESKLKSNYTKCCSCNREQFIVSVRCPVRSPNKVINHSRYFIMMMKMKRFFCFSIKQPKSRLKPTFTNVPLQIITIVSYAHG